MFAEQYNFPVDNIEIEFFITRRKVFDGGDFPQKRIQEFIPSSGKVKLNKARNLLESFILEVFDGNGEFKNTEFEKRANKHNCHFCPYKDNPDLCDAKSPELLPSSTFFRPS